MATCHLLLFPGNKDLRQSPGGGSTGRRCPRETHARQEWEVGERGGSKIALAPASQNSSRVLGQGTPSKQALWALSVRRGVSCTRLSLGRPQVYFWVMSPALQAARCGRLGA